MASRRGGSDRKGAILVASLALASTAIRSGWDDPPRFDGAGYAVLARAIGEGRGYREIDHPDAPRHAHFPPGYPLALAGLWAMTGPSVRAAHLASIACSTLASVAAWAWFRRMYRPGVALLLGSAVAVNWAWGRAGGSIRAEPLFFLLEMTALLAATRLESSRRGRVDIVNGVGLGLLLGACVLTRHVGACLALAVVVDLAIGRRGSTAIAAAIAALMLVAPWAAWVASVGRGTQVGLIPTTGFREVVSGNALFYLRRIPDQLIGPVVEIGTVFRPGWIAPATASAAVASAAVAFGWWKASKTPRRRLASRVAWATLALLLLWPFTEAGRFLIPLVPMILVGALEGLARLVPTRKWGRPRLPAAAFLLAVSLPYSIYSVGSNRAGAERRTHADFDAACAWIAADRDHPGPVLGRHPGEIFWQTGRLALSPQGDDTEGVGHLVDHYGVSLLLDDRGRFARAPTSPLGLFARDHPDRVGRIRRFGGVELFAVRPAVPKPG